MLTKFLIQKIYWGYFGDRNYFDVRLNTPLVGTKMDKFVLSSIEILARYGSFCILFWVLTLLGTLCYSLLSWCDGILSYREVALYVSTWTSCFIIWRLVIWND